MIPTVTQHARTVAVGSAVAMTLALALIAYLIAAGHARASRGETTVLRYQDFAGRIGVAELAADLGYLPGLKLQCIGDTTSGAQDIQATVNGDVAFGTAFNGSILRLAGAGAPITAVVAARGLTPQNRTSFAVRVAGPVRGPRGLIGKRVGVNTVGAQSEDVLDLYLARHGLTPAQIRSVQPVVLAPDRMEPALRAGRVAAAALTGAPRDTAFAHGGLRELFSDYGLLGRTNADSIVMRDDFVAANPHTVRTFVSGVARALAWSARHPRAQVIARMTRIARHRTPPAALPHGPGYDVATEGGVLTRHEFAVWLRRLERDGRVPPGAVRLNALWTNAYNPYARQSAAVGRQNRKAPPK